MLRKQFVILKLCPLCENVDNFKFYLIKWLSIYTVEFALPVYTMGLTFYKPGDEIHK